MTNVMTSGKNFCMLLCMITLAMSFTSAQQSSFLPQNLGPAVNSEYDEINPVISPDGKTLYFVRVNHPENTYGAFDSQDIWYSEWKNGKWTQAKRDLDLNIARYNSVVAVIDGGETLIINGVFNKAGTFWKSRGLSICKKTSAGWSAPVRLKVKKLNSVNDGANSGASMSADGTTLYLSLAKFYNSEKTNIFYSEKKSNGKWKKPKKVKALNSKSSDESPFLSTDKKTIYFASDRVEQNQFDIYKSTRPGSGDLNWTQPIKLSDTVNSKNWENQFKTTVKGSYAFFSSTNKTTGGADIFTVKLFEENPFVIVKGNVVNSNTQLPLNRQFKIIINGKPWDSLKLNIDSSTYSVKLPLRSKYEIEAVAYHANSKKEIVDVSTVKEFTKMTKDLFVTPMDYARVTGTVIDRSTSAPVSAFVDAKILLNNLSSDSIHFDKLTGRYSLNLKLGHKYSLTAHAPKFESVSQVLDLTKMTEYQEITQDLYLETEKMVAVSGQVLNKKTNSSFKPFSKVQVVFNGGSPLVAAIDTAANRYVINLPPDAVYNITASAPDCVPVYETIDLTGVAKGTTLTKDLTLTPIEVGQSVRLKNIFFESGRAVLKKESFVELDRVYEFLSGNASVKVEIAGHTDNVGSAATNLALSKARAQAVANYLIKKGIAGDRLKSTGYGMTKPITSNATADGKSQNRRVEFVILDK